MNPAPNTKARVLPLRRLLLAATVASVAIGGFLAAPSLSPYAPIAHAQNLSQEAERVARPVGFADIVEKVKPAVISVRVKMRMENQDAQNGDDLPFPKGSPMERFFKRFGMPDGGPQAPRGRQFGSAQGSGFFISADGYAVTNNHVVDKATTVEVSTDDGKVHSAKVIGTDSRTDLALIKVDGSNFPYVKLSDAPPRIGDWVLAVGNPFGLGGTVTAGIVSARGRDIGAGPYDDFLQIDAPVNKGNSGGPTFNTEGSVIGVNTAIFSPSGGSVGIAFAIPAETVKSVVAQLKDKGSVTRGWIGVQIQPLTPEIADSLGIKQTAGALVAEPQKDSPALKAGIQAGDVITAVDGKPVVDARDLARRIGQGSERDPMVGVQHEDLTFTLPKADGARTMEKLRTMQAAEGWDDLTYDDEIGKVSLVGAGMKSHPGVTAEFTEALRDVNVNMELISTSEIRISVLTREADLDKAARALHDKFQLGGEEEATVYAGTGR